MTTFLNKMEEPRRLGEIQINKSLERAGLVNGHVVVDYGAGTGVFCVAAAKVTSGKVYALDMNPDALAVIEAKVKEEKLDNVEVVDIKPDQVPLEDGGIDLFMLITVLHEIDEVPDFVSEVKRVLKPGGRVMIIDFHKKESPIGPPIEHRVSPYQAARHFLREDITFEEQLDLGDNLYLLVLKK